MPALILLWLLIYGAWDVLLLRCSLENLLGVSFKGLKLCSRFCTKCQIYQRPCLQREKIFSTVAFEEIQQSGHPLLHYSSIHLLKIQVMLMFQLSN
uniref:Uncharacterized protein MANES_05G169900 n=1 Tax=Rhizophora mucronata TaxID=61149 RepID=A0A2P2LPA9_RHIMU